MDKGKYNVKCSYEHCRTCKDYSTLWMTYVCGDIKFRKRVRIWHENFSGIWCFERDIWGFLRERVGKKLDACGSMNITELKYLIERTRHFDSDDWGESMRNFVLEYEYGGNNLFKELEGRYNSQCKIDKSLITSEYLK